LSAARLAQATALNMIDMIGVGPFITIPLMIATMHGPQAMLGWILGAVLVVCDGMVWAELGASMPQAGGPVRYLRAMYPGKAGRWLSFLFVFQLTFSAPLSMASGCIGFAQYASYLWPSLAQTITSQKIPLPIPGIGAPVVEFTITRGTPRDGVARSPSCSSIAASPDRPWRRSVDYVIGTTPDHRTGLTHFNAAQAFSRGRVGSLPRFSQALCAADRGYDYWGHYNVCYLGAEIRDPPRDSARDPAVDRRRRRDTRHEHLDPRCDAVAGGREACFRASDFMARIWGPRAAVVVTILMLWTAFASVFSLLLGYSRVPYAAAVDGDYFPVFARVHPKHHFPHVSLLVLGSAAIVFCLFRLADVVTALVVIRIVVQFLAQTIGITSCEHAAPNSAAVQDVAVSAARHPRVPGLHLHCGDAAQVD
jgi:hypothetical protein